MGYLSYELESEEKLIKVVRKHWSVFLFPFFRIIFIVFTIFLFFDFFRKIPYGMELLFVIILSLILYLVYEFLLWGFNCYLITDKKVIDIDQKNILKRVVVEVRFDSIEEIFYELNGFWGSILNFGDVKINLTSGNMIVMEKIGHPEEVTKNIKYNN